MSLQLQRADVAKAASQALQSGSSQCSDMHEGTQPLLQVLLCVDLQA